MMKLVASFVVTAGVLASISTAVADKFDACPNAKAARQLFNTRMQENACNTNDASGERALGKF